MKNKRGFYRDKSYKKWSRDHTTTYFEGTVDRVYWPIMKIIHLCVLYYVMWTHTASVLASVVFCVLVVVSYQHVVAFILPNTIVMPAMDLQTFYSSPEVHINYINVT